MPGFRPGWIGFIIFVYVIGLFLGITYDADASGATFSATSNTSATYYDTSPQQTLQEMYKAEKAIIQNPIYGTVSMVFNPSAWDALYRITTWQWAFLYDESGNMISPMFYWIFLFPWIATFAFAMLVIIFNSLRGNVSIG